MRDRKDIPPATPLVPAAKASRKTRISIVWIVPIIAAVVAGYLIFDRIKAAGPTIKITFTDGGGLSANQTTLRYRGVKVGLVHSVKLSEDGRRVEVEAHLAGTAARLASDGSLFWIVRPEVTAGGLRGLQTIVSGPFIQAEPGQGKERKEFIGSEETPVLNPPGSLNVVISTPHLGTLNSGAPVYYRGLEVGSVQRMILNGEATAIDIHLQIQPQYASLVRQNTEFWNAGGLNVSLKLFGINVSAESVQSLLVGGIAFATPSPPGAMISSNTVFPLHEKPEEKWLNWAPLMPGWAGANDPPTNASPPKAFPPIGSLGTNGGK